MTLRGYSVLIKENQDARSSTEGGVKSTTCEERARKAAPPQPEAPLAKPPLPRRQNPSRPHLPLGEGPGLRPSSIAARQALSTLAKATSNIEQHLALIEMLIALGPEVREKGTLDESLQALKKMEDDLSKGIAGVLRSCDDIRQDGASD